VTVPTPSGAVMMTVPKWTNTGRVLRLKGKGVPRPDGGRGDEHVTLKVMLPETPDPELEKLITQWRPASVDACVRYPSQMRNRNQNLGGSRARRWDAYLWHEWTVESRRPIAPAFARPNPAEWSDNRVTAAWLGHATVLINFFGIKILTVQSFFHASESGCPGLHSGLNA